jgi:hypothetical protein
MLDVLRDVMCNVSLCVGVLIRVGWVCRCLRFDLVASSRDGSVGDPARCRRHLGLAIGMRRLNNDIVFGFVEGVVPNFTAPILISKVYFVCKWYIVIRAEMI